jgi:hypothetical protein
MDIKVTWKFLLLLTLGSCVNTKSIMNKNGLIELSQNGDYIRPIKISTGYYYNSPKNGKVIHIKNK